MFFKNYFNGIQSSALSYYCLGKFLAWGRVAVAWGCAFLVCVRVCVCKCYIVFSHLVSYVDSVRSMEDKLRTTPLVTQLPLGSGREFTGVIDLLTMDLLVWDKGGDGTNFANVPLIPCSQDMKYKNFSKLGRLSELVKTTPISRERLEEALEARYNLAEQVQ